jgi:hypothetical protein
VIIADALRRWEITGEVKSRSGGGNEEIRPFYAFTPFSFSKNFRDVLVSSIEASCGI